MSCEIERPSGALTSIALQTSHRRGGKSCPLQDRKVWWLQLAGLKPTTSICIIKTSIAVGRLHTLAAELGLCHAKARS